MEIILSCMYKNSWVNYLFILVGLSKVSIKLQLESEYFQWFNTLVSLLDNNQIASYLTIAQTSLKTTRVTGPLNDAELPRQTYQV